MIKGGGANIKNDNIKAEEEQQGESIGWIFSKKRKENTQRHAATTRNISVVIRQSLLITKEYN